MAQKSSSDVEDIEVSLAQLANIAVFPGLQGAEAILRSIVSSLTPHRSYKDITLMLAQRAVNVTVQISTLIEATKEAPQWLRHVDRLAEVLHEIRLFIQTETQDRALHRVLRGKVRCSALERRLSSVLDDAERCNTDLRRGSPKAVMSEELPAEADSIRPAQSQTPSSSLMNNSDVIRSSEMFSNAHHLTLIGCNTYSGNSYNAGGQISIQHGSGQESIQGIVPGICVVAFDDISISQEIYKHQRYRLHSDNSKGKLRVVKVYQGHRAKERAQEAAMFHKKVLHPTFPHIVGVSPLNCEVPFLVFNGGLEGSLDVSIAKALEKDLKKSLILGLQTVIGLSAGLDYIRDVDYPFVNARSEHFRAFLNFEGAVVVSFDPDISYQQQSDVIHDAHDEQSSLSQVDVPLLIFHELCEQTFDAACQVHYEQRQVERPYDTLETGLDTETFPSFNDRPDPDSSDPASPAVLATSVRGKVQAAGHRRELVWKPEKEKSSSLEDICLQFKAFLNDILISSEPLLHRRRGRYTAGIAHRCPGYNRTEITLTPSITRSAIVSHSTPLPQEICPVCKQVVNNVEIFNCKCGREDDESMPTIQCLKCSIWHHRYCVVGFESTARSFTCPDCQTVPSLDSLLKSLHLPNLPETSLLSSSQLLTNHVLNHPIRRPRTHTKVFQSHSDLAAHYGIPEILPPAPRMTNLHQPAKSPLLDFQILSSNYLSMLSGNPSDNTNMTDPHQPAKSPILDFQTLSSNYLSMLSGNPSDNTNMTDPHQPAKSPILDFQTLSSNYLSMLSGNPSDNTNMTDPVAPLPVAISPEEMSAPVIPNDNVDIANPLRATLADPSWEALMDEYSPWTPNVATPYPTTPQDSILDTPLFEYLDDSPMLTGVDYNAPLFPALFSPSP